VTCHQVAHILACKSQFPFSFRNQSDSHFQCLWSVGKDHGVWLILLSLVLLPEGSKLILESVHLVEEPLEILGRRWIVGGHASCRDNG
jgi:hypothetical protein